MNTKTLFVTTFMVCIMVVATMAPAVAYNGVQDPEHNVNPQNRNGTVEHNASQERPNGTGYGEADPTVGIGCPWLDTYE